MEIVKGICDNCELETDLTKIEDIDECWCKDCVIETLIDFEYIFEMVDNLYEILALWDNENYTIEDERSSVVH